MCHIKKIFLPSKIITWEPATANHPIEGKLRTRQTSGPKSGTLLRAIVYNVTYEAKTQDGFVSFCRASFDVVLISQLQCVKPDQSYTCPDGYNVGDMCSLNCKDGLVPTKFLTIICLPILQWSSNTLCEDKEKPVFLDCPTRALRIEERKNMTGRTLRVVDNVDTDLSVRLGPPDKSWYTRPRVEEIITATDRNENSAVCVITIDVKETLCGDREEALRKLNISDIVMLDGELAVCRIPGLEKKKMPMKCITDKVLNISSWEDEKLTLLCQDLDCRPKTPIKNSWIKYYEHIDGYFLDCDEGFYKPKLDSDYECSTRTSKRWRPTIPTNSTCTAGKVMNDFMFAVWLVYGSNACIEVNKTTMEKMSKTIIDLNLMDDVLKLFPQSFIGVTNVRCLPPDSYYYLGVDRRRRATVLKRAPSKRISHGFDRVSYNNRTKRFKRLRHNKMATSQKEILVGPKRAYKYQIEVTITFKIDVTPDKHVPIMDDIDDLMFFFETSSNDKSFILKNSSQILDAKYLGSAASYVIKPCEVPLVYAMQYNFYLACIGCGIGAVFTNDSRECAVCPLGTYQPLTEGAECLPCPPDWNTNNSGAGSLEECYANCGRGYYKTHRSHSCRPCPLGTYQPLEDGRECLPCPAVWTSESPTECSGKLLCKRNYYSNTGHEPCIKCGLDQITLAIGRKYCDATIKCSFGMANQITETKNHCEFYDVILNKDFIFYAFLGRSNNSIQAWFNFPHNLYNSQVVFSLGQEPGAAYFGCDDFTLSIYSAPADRVKIKKLGTWNIRTLHESSRSAQVAKEMRKYELEVLGLSETRWNGSGQTRLISRETVTYSGHEDKDHEHTQDEVNRMVRKSAKKDKRQYIQEMTEDTETAAGQGNMKRLYEVTRTLSGKNINPNKPVKDKVGNIQTSDAEQRNRWAQHFEELLNHLLSANIPNIPPANHPLNVCTDPPTQSDTIRAIKNIQMAKQLARTASPAISADILHTLLKQIWEDKIIQSDWKLGYLIKLPMKGDLTQCNNWKGIMLLSAPSKVLTRIIIERLRDALDKKLRQEQACFLQDRSCMDLIATRLIIIEQSFEWQSFLYMTFVDFEKAFDSVNRDVIWKLMSHYGIFEKCITITQKLYEDSPSQVESLQLPKGTLKIKNHFNCESRNVVYVIQCRRCNIFYIGQTGKRLFDRVSQHLRSINNEDGLPVAKHFNKSGHDLKKDFCIFLFVV
ncbi:uncharacterized protein LOC131956122 [Physella acuta]|uniref:uncharacterized protein LOC131956122 n=1 Tax=Physella acuta TaxID=109671 RepID=UPI0027DE5F02|nr:uncharacterized protein LOC131956122 [Physella acuta]